MSRVKKAKEQSEDFRRGLVVDGIELIQCSINAESVSKSSELSFDFNTEVQQAVNFDSKQLLVTVSVDVKSKTGESTYFSLVLNCLYSHEKFDHYVKADKQLVADVPPQLVEILADLSLSTARGVMYSTLKGTTLHSIILPVYVARQTR